MNQELLISIENLTETKDDPFSAFFSVKMDGCNDKSHNVPTLALQKGHLIGCPGDNTLCKCHMLGDQPTG